MQRSYVDVMSVSETELEPGEIAQNSDAVTESRRQRRSAESRRRSRSPGERRPRREELRRPTRSPKSRHHRDPHRREKRPKRHKRQRQDTQLQSEERMEIDAVALPEEEEIERQREERRKRIAAIKTKHQKRAEAQTPVEGEKSCDSVSSAECAFVKSVVEKSLAEVETDATLKCFENAEGSDCSADRCAMLNDEKHDKEKLLGHSDVTEAPPPVQDFDDIFCETPDAAATKTYQSLDNAVKKAAANRGLTDAYDDPEGYYKFRIGEIMDSRYEILAFKGKGVFSTVLCGRDKVRKDASGVYPEVCIKVIRANDLMKNCGKREGQFLKLLSSTDPENKRHCIRLLRSFVHRGHLCLVFEPMAMNLRELTKKYGRDVGLSMDGVGHFTAQLLVALKHLKINKLLHADIKPDNVLVNEKCSRVKLCDFGSAMEDWNTEITPYVCSRFYRPPEVILGLKYSYGMDMWSLGCVIYEMFTGQYLFPGRTNNAMLKLMMDVKGQTQFPCMAKLLHLGAFPKKLLKKATFCDEHFEKDVNMSFIEIDVDKFTKKPTKRLLSNPTVKHNFHALLNKFAEGCQPRLVTQLADLLEKMMMLDPEKRLDVDDALRHPFVRAFLHKSVPPAPDSSRDSVDCRAKTVQQQKGEGPSDGDLPK